MPSPQEKRFAAYVEGLARAAGHRDRETPPKDYCRGLLLPGARKSPAVGGVVVDEGKEGDLPIAEGEAGRGVNAPQLIGPLGQDRALVPLRLDEQRLPLRRQPLVFAHQPQQARLGGPHAGQPRPRRTLRWPPPEKGDSWMVRRISPTSCSSVQRVFGPLLPGGGETCRRRSW